MKVTFCLPVSLGFLALAAGVPSLRAGTQSLAAPVPTVKPAVEITMPTEPGKVYQMQVSADLSTWQNHGDPFFGTGAAIARPMSGGTHQFFRLLIVTAPVMGKAPWHFHGTALQCNDGTLTAQYQFLANGQGTRRNDAASRLFTWTWLRDGTDSGLAELTYPGGVREVIQFHYTALQVGQFTRKNFLGARLKDTESGSFGPAPATGATLVPSSITGRSFAFSERPSGSGLTLTATGGQRLLDGKALPFNGNWLPTEPSIFRLIAEFGPHQREEYKFTFTGPLTGRYTRQTFTEGVFRDDDQGTFCLSPAP